MDEPGVDLKVILAQYELTAEFPANVVKETEAAAASVPESEIAKRSDFRPWTTITIDPETAKDHDDAISIARHSNGNYVLAVHIADVAYYVREGSALDACAYERGNSVYFPGFVVPMLPHALSSRICSLVEGENRLTQTAVMDLGVLHRPTVMFGDLLVAETEALGCGTGRSKMALFGEAALGPRRRAERARAPRKRRCPCRGTNFLNRVFRLQDLCEHLQPADLRGDEVGVLPPEVDDGDLVVLHPFPHFQGSLNHRDTVVLLYFRYLATSKSAREAATEALSESEPPRMGMRTARSQCSATRRERPLPSAPTTSTRGALQSIPSSKSDSPIHGERNARQAGIGGLLQEHGLVGHEGHAQVFAGPGRRLDHGGRDLGRVMLAKGHPGGSRAQGASQDGPHILGIRQVVEGD